MIHVHAEAVKNINTAAAEINNQIRCSIFRGAVENRPFVFRKDTNEDFMHDPGEPLFPLFYRNHSLCGPVLPVSLHLGSRRCFLLWNRRTSPSEQQTRRAGRIFTSAGYKKQSDCSGSPLHPCLFDSGGSDIYGDVPCTAIWRKRASPRNAF